MSPPKRRRRAYIGNLRPRPDLARSLHDDLFAPHRLLVRNYPDGDGIAVALPRVSGARSAYALVEFDDVEYAIRVLDGAVFDGRTLRVSRERTHRGGIGGGPGGRFGSSRWAGDDDDGGFAGPEGARRNGESKSRADGARAPDGVKIAVVSNENCGQNELRDDGFDGCLDREEAIVKGVESLISSEIEESPDEVTAAIACTAAMALLSSVDAFGLDREPTSGETNLTASSGKSGNDRGVHNGVDCNEMSGQDFRSRCEMPVSELLAEYGEQDLDWKKHQQAPHPPQDKAAKDEKDLTSDDFQSRRNMPLSSLLAEYGEQDLEWKKDENPALARTNHTKSTSFSATNSKPQSNAGEPSKRVDANESNGMLAPRGKAPIHVELVSFGYKYNAPRREGGFSHARPLPPLDVRDLDRAPGHVAKFDGLHHLVKRALLNPAEGNSDVPRSVGVDGGGNDNRGSLQDRQLSPMRRRANDIADEVIRALVEAVDEGGHGPASPLTMGISLGSEYGRHRSVVLVEHLAVVLRARLRRNDGRRFHETEGRGGPGTNGIVRQPVSVGTRHRDLGARHQDREAFGQDLKGGPRAAEWGRRERRSEESEWDDGGW